MGDNPQTAGRRSFLAITGSALSLLTGASGVVAGKRRSHGERSLRDILDHWERRHGGLASSEILDGENDGSQVQILVRLEYSDGTVKHIKYVSPNSDEDLIVRANGRSYSYNAQKSNGNVAKSSLSANRTGVSAQAVDPDEGPGTLPRGSTIPNPPKILPGESVSGSSANSGQSWEKGDAMGAQEVLSNESSFKAGAFSGGAFITAYNKAGVQLWREFQVGYESDISTPSVQVEFDYSYSAHAAVGGGSAQLKANTFFNAANQGDVWFQKIDEKNAARGDWWNNSGSGTSSFETEVRPGEIYRFGVHIDTQCQALATSIARADVHQDHDGGVNVGDFTISWT